MATIRTSLKGTLSGATEGGSLCSTAFSFDLDNQDTHGKDAFTIDPGDTARVLTLSTRQQEFGLKQTLFLLQTTGDVEIRLNGFADLAFSLKANGILAFSGQPEVGTIEVTSLQPTEFKIVVSRVFGPSTLPDPGNGPPAPGGGAPLVMDQFAATAGQTAFVLSQTPSGAVGMYVEGVFYSSPVFFTRIGTAVTWLDVPFVLPLGARVEFVYN